MSTDFPVSILDTDLYKLTMGQAVYQQFPDTQARYKFINRSRDMAFTEESLDWIQRAIKQLAAISLQSDELNWLRATCPYLSDSFLDFLFSFRFRPEQLSLKFLPLPANSARGHIEIEISGPWCETIMWEVPLLAIVSEAFYLTVDTTWNYEGQQEKGYEKGRTLFSYGCDVIEFGTRRRRSYKAQAMVIQSLIRAQDEVAQAPSSCASSRGAFLGTSNVHFARLNGLSPVGTIAHEWTMGIAALKGIKNANTIALDIWEKVYPLEKSDALHIALTDTFSSDVFFKELDYSRALSWRGIRQDSGDPFSFATKACNVYQSMGVDPKDKLIVFSDSLDVDLCVKLKKFCDELGIKASFGIGTNLTNDFVDPSSEERSQALNIVIKLSSVDGNMCIKISDDLSKNTGDLDTIRKAKVLLGIDTS